MATTTHTTETHTCDMCGAEQDKGSLITVSVGTAGRGVDVCRVRQDRKIAGLVAVADRGRTRW